MKKAMIKLAALLMVCAMVLPLAACTTDVPATGTSGGTATSAPTAGTATSAPTTGAPATGAPTTDTSETITLYVSPNGNDSGAGSEDDPLATLAKAIEVVNTAGGNAVVNVLAGNHVVAETVHIYSNNITVQGAEGAVISGGVSISGADFAPVNDTFAAYLTDDAKAHVVEIDLTKYGFDAAALAEMSNREKVIYLDNERLDLARWPNKTNGIDDNIRVTAAEALNGRVDWKVTVTDDIAERMAKWHTAENITVFGYFMYLWRTSWESISEINAAEKYFVMPGECEYGVKTSASYFFMNVAEELDAEGEYYIDTDGMLYIYAGEDFASSTVSVPKSQWILSVNGNENVTIDGLTFEHSTDYAVVAYGNNITFSNNTVRNCGAGVGFGFGSHAQATNSTISNNEIYNVEREGVSASCGDSATLTASGTKIINNNIYNWSLDLNKYLAGLQISGVGCYIANNEIHGSTHTAVFFSGNNHIFEYNEIYDVLTYTEDAGVIYSGRTLNNIGNTIRYNYIHDIGNTKLRDVGLVGIYLDDGLTGQIMYGNVFDTIRSGTAFGIGGGRNHTVTGNIVINCDYAITYDNRVHEGFFTQNGWKHIAPTLKDNLDNESDVYLNAFPWLKDINTDFDNADENDPTFIASPAGSVIKDNVYILTKRDGRMYDAADDKETFKTKIHDVVRGFSEVENLDFIRIDTNSYTFEDIAAMEFPEGIEIDFSKIGRAAE